MLPNNQLTIDNGQLTKKSQISNLKCQMSNGFTLVELLVVISIMALLGVVAFVNFKDFAQDQVINKAIGQIQTALRLAQANATSGVTCLGLGGADWSVQIRRDGTNVDLICGSSNSVVQTTILENVVVENIEKKGPFCTSPTMSLPLIVTYSSLSGAVKIDDIGSCSEISIRVKNMKTEKDKTFTISSGGAINVQ